MVLNLVINLYLKRFFRGIWQIGTFLAFYILGDLGEVSGLDGLSGLRHRFRYLNLCPNKHPKTEIIVQIKQTVGNITLYFTMLFRDTFLGRLFGTLFCKC